MCGVHCHGLGEVCIPFSPGLPRMGWEGRGCTNTLSPLGPFGSQFHLSEVKLEPDWVKLAPHLDSIWTPGNPTGPLGTPLGAGTGLGPVLGTSRALKCDACA